MPAITSLEDGRGSRHVRREKGESLKKKKVLNVTERARQTKPGTHPLLLGSQRLLERRERVVLVC